MYELVCPNPPFVYLSYNLHLALALMYYAIMVPILYQYWLYINMLIIYKPTLYLFIQCAHFYINITTLPCGLHILLCNSMRIELGA